jgi:hypothetical protein
MLIARPSVAEGQAAESQGSPTEAMAKVLASVSLAALPAQVLILQQQEEA